MNDPQIWTLIGVFAAAMLGGFTVVITSLSRVVRAEIAGLRGELGGEIGGLRGELSGEISGLKGQISGLNTRFDALEKRLDHLDSDVQAITDRLWRGERDT